MFRKLATLALSFATLLVFAAPAPAVSCRFSPLTQVSALGTFYGTVTDTVTGKELVSIRPTEPTPSASVLKILIGVAAVLHLPKGYRVSTTIYTIDGFSNTIVLRGGGDPTLSRLLPPSYSTYPKPARLPKLAEQVLAKLPADFKIRNIIIDTSAYDGVAYNPFWKSSDRINGYVSPITPLAVDAGRMNPDLTDKKYSGTRVEDPVAQAAAVFKKALGVRGKNAFVEYKPVSYLNLRELTSIKSAPMELWVDHGMKYSDNSEVEYTARAVLARLGLKASFAEIEPMIKQTLDQLGVSSKGLVMKDASGLAQDNRVTARMISSLLVEASKPSSPVSSFPQYLASPTSAGTLSTRFKGANALPKDAVLAKTGFIPGLYSLAGYVTAKDKRKLAFAFFARGGGVGGNTRSTLDSLVVRAYTCGAKLTE
ncbi:MAG: hypothetical protein RLZZ108_501 [Actinomycetota bacterium]